MKQILLTAFALTALSSSSFAHESDCCHDEHKHEKRPEHSPIYLRTDLLGQKFHKEFINRSTYKNQNYSYGADAGLGYYLTKRIRAELVYNHNFMTRFKANNNNTLYKGKATAKAVFARAMFDVISFECTQFFVGAGAGLARTSNKMNIAPNAAGVGAQYESKSSTNFAYSFHAGAATRVAEGVKFEASWGMRNYGTTSKLVHRTTGDALNGSKLKLRSQVIAAGFRFDV